MSVRHYSFRQGDRSEYLAQYLLSELGICAPIPRQEDVGFDFHCSIFQQERDLLSNSHQFLIQVKSSMDAIEYGGAFRSSGKWKKYDILWLKELSIPLLIGIIDKKEETLQIFSTSAVQMVFLKCGNPQRIQLVPRFFEEGSEQFSHEPKIFDDEKILSNDDNREPKTGDGKIHKVDLGPPLVKFSSTDIKDISQLIKIKNLLREAIEIHNRSILYENLGAPFREWTREIFTNDKVIGGWIIQINSGFTHSRIIDRLIPLVLSLYLNAKIKNDKDLMNALTPLIGNYIPKDHPIILAIKNDLPAILKDLKI